MLVGRSVLSEVGRNFLSSLIATTGVAFFMISVNFLKRTPGVGLGFLVEVFPLFFPMALQFTVPLAVLTSTVLTVGRMAGDGEITALSACGISPWAFIRPILAGAAVVALCALLLTDILVPFAAARLRQAKRDLPHQLQTSFRAGLSDLDLGDARISFERFEGGEFTDLCIEWNPAPDELHLWRAEEGSITVTDDDRLLFELERARAVMPFKGKATVSLDRFASDISLSEITGTSGRTRSRTDLTAWELAYVGARAIPTNSGLRINSPKAMEELVRRSALAASAFFFALIGIPLGVMSARGGRVGAFVLAVAPVLIIYFPVLIAASNLARSGSVPSYPALWAANLLLAVVALLLMRRLVLR
ncbi:MAG: LptF/LptG family permease [Planctomycetota bacterium]|jgi:lipopolysaccharide export system permease protein